MVRFILNFLLIFSLLTVSIEANAFKKASDKYEIDINILYTMAKIESKLSSLAIGTMSKTKYQKDMLVKFLKLIDCKFTSSKKNHRVSIYPTDIEQAKMALMIINKFKVNYDVGLMQINRYNVNRRKLDKDRLVVDPEYNIMIGAKILDECIQRNDANLKNSFECYNKGTDKRKYNGSYYALFLKEYRKTLENQPSKQQLLISH